MKIIIQINKKDSGKRMLEFTNLCVTKTKKENMFSDTGKTYAYSAIMKYSNSDEILYEKEFSIYEVTKPNEKCNKYIDEIIQKIQTAVTNAKKRHQEFTDVIELD